MENHWQCLAQNTCTPQHFTHYTRCAFREEFHYNYVILLYSTLHSGVSFLLHILHITQTYMWL